MNIQLTNQEKEEIFFNAMCNGLSNVSYWEFEIDYNSEDYQSAKESLLNNGKSSVCYEEVFMEMLKSGKSIEFVDLGCDGEYTKSLTMDMIHKNIEKTPMNNLFNVAQEQDDSFDADAILQSVLFEEIIFG
jgi:hypothetical protein